MLVSNEDYVRLDGIRFNDDQLTKTSSNVDMIEQYRLGKSLQIYL